MAYDLLIKGGHVLDPGQNLDGVLDIAVTDGKIAAIQPDIAPAEAVRTIRVKGENRYVVPGLIDIHTHVAYGAQTPGVGMGCVKPDVGGVQSGATTVLDCGSVGVANIGVFKYHILPHAKTRIVVFLNVGSFAHTMPSMADVNRLEALHASVGAALAGALAPTPPMVGCHVSHVYPDGASLYFTVLAAADRNDPAGQWVRAKRAASDAIAAAGATITHHHAVGRDHAPWLEAETGPLGLAALRAVKAELDPAGIMNPGKLL